MPIQRQTIVKLEFRVPWARKIFLRALSQNLQTGEKGFFETSLVRAKSKSQFSIWDRKCPLRKINFFFVSSTL